jgi:hypothetical protein
MEWLSQIGLSRLQISLHNSLPRRRIDCLDNRRRTRYRYASLDVASQFLISGSPASFIENLSRGAILKSKYVYA